jgi:hypothetical protein
VIIFNPAAITRVPLRRRECLSPIGSDHCHAIQRRAQGFAHPRQPVQIPHGGDWQQKYLERFKKRVCNLTGLDN